MRSKKEAQEEIDWQEKEIESKNHYCESSGEKCNQQCKFCKNEE